MRVRIRAMAATTLLTSDQFLALPEEFDQHGNEVRQELISAEVVGMPAPTKRDAIIRSNIFEALLAYLHANPAVSFNVLSRAAFVVSSSCVFIPDLALLVRSRLNTADSYLQGAADLARSIILYRADAIQDLKANQSITDPLLPGFSSPLAAFFELT